MLARDSVKTCLSIIHLLQNDQHFFPCEPLSLRGWSKIGRLAGARETVFLCLTFKYGDDRDAERSSSSKAAQTPKLMQL
jgi:hypothetical protein